MPETIDTEEQIIMKECGTGNTARFGELYGRYVKKIYRYVYYKTLHRQTAEDITADVFFKVLKNIGKFDPGRRFSPWIYQIAKNATVDYLRKRHQTANIEDVWDIAYDADLEGKLDDKIAFEKIKSVLKELSQRECDILIMRIWEGMHYKEIAEIIGETEGNCKVIFSRTVAKLRTDLLISFLLLALTIKK